MKLNKKPRRNMENICKFVKSNKSVENINIINFGYEKNPILSNHLSLLPVILYVLLSPETVYCIL